MKKFSIVFSWVLSLGLLAGCSAPHTQPSMQKPVSAMPALPLDSDKDGVDDKTDQCMNTPLTVIVDSVGCPLEYNLPSESMFEFRVFFDKSSATIKPLYLQELHQVVKNRLKSRSDVTAVIIAGTSSDEGDFKAEKMQLSKQRALQLKNTFIQLMGTDPNNTIAIGCGDYNAIANEHSENGSALNRRIYMQFGSDIDNRQLVLDKFGQLKAPYKHCEIAH